MRSNCCLSVLSETLAISRFSIHFLPRLKKHGPPKAKGSLAALWGTSHGGMKKAAAAKNWRDVVKQGVHIIRSSPYDAVCLLAMANACKNLEQNEAQRSYLRAALEAAPADVEVNKQCAAFLKSCGEFDQAIACWLRISNVPKFSDEAQKAMSELHVEKTIVAGNGLVGRESATKKSSDNIDESSSTVPRITLLRQAIEKILPMWSLIWSLPTWSKRMNRLRKHRKF